MAGLAFMALMYKGFKEDYIRNHGNDEGYTGKFFLYTVGTSLAVVIAHATVIPHFLALIAYLSYHAYKGYKEA